MEIVKNENAYRAESGLGKNFRPSGELWVKSFQRDIRCRFFFLGDSLFMKFIYDERFREF